MSFAALKKQSKAGALTERLMKKVEKLNEKGGNNTDERLWKPAVDKAVSYTHLTLPTKA